MLSLSELQIPPPKSWETFESLILDLMRAVWNDSHAQRNGRRGQAQQGVDVFGQPTQSTGWAGVQCKNKDLLVRSVLTVKELRQEVHRAKLFRPPLSQFIIATTSARDARIQEEARKITTRHRRVGLFSVHVYSWEDVQDLLGQYETVARRYYGNVGQSAGAAVPMLPEGTVSAVLRAKPKSASNRPARPQPVAVLSAPASKALGILATSPVPFPTDVLKKLFVEVDWTVVLRELTDATVVSLDDSLVRVADASRDQLLPTAAARAEFVDRWIDALLPLAHHVDMAIFLALQFVSRGEVATALKFLVPIATNLERGVWNDQYTAILGALSAPEILRKLTTPDRRTFYTAYGLCLTRAGKPKDALTWARRLLDAGTRRGDAASIAQALLQFGLAHQYLGDHERSAQFYERSAQHAKRHRVYLVEGHALHNLAMLRVDADPVEAGRLLELSIAAKRRAHDEPGRVGALFGRGSVAANAGDFKAAFKWFSRAERLAARWDSSHARALALSNMGKSLVDQGKSRESIRFYRKAESIADREGLPDALAMSAGGLAVAYLETALSVNVSRSGRQQ